jgi:hypothetical protein
VALAWFTNSQQPIKFYFHEGSAFGYVTEIRIYPEQGIASVLLVNTTRLPHKKIMDQVDAEFLPVKGGSEK